MATLLSQPGSAESPKGTESTTSPGVDDECSDFNLKQGIIRTNVSPRVAWAMIVLFLAILFGIPLSQMAIELARGSQPRVLDLVRRDSFPTRHDLKQFEDALHDESLVKQWVQPRVQEGVSTLGFGNPQVIVGRDGWLFYRPGIDYVTGPGFLEPWRLHQRGRNLKDVGAGHIEPDPRIAILAFRDQCARAGARLVLVPIPDKAMLEPWRLTSRFDAFAALSPPNNPSYLEFLRELQTEGVEVLDVTPATIHQGDVRFLAQDTHWAPTWMDDVAQSLAKYLGARHGLNAVEKLVSESANVSRVGDLVDMLRLPADQRLFPPETVTIHPVVTTVGQPLQPNPSSSVLLLGDSFTNIYSAEPMGWGKGAGFAERLSFHLSQRIDWIARNDHGAHATRQILADEQRRGRDRLAGKRVVVWQFAMRELAVGDWKRIDIASKPAPSKSADELKFLTLAPGESRRLRGEVKRAAAAPVPGTVPYKDHIIAVHLVNLRDEQNRPIDADAALIYLWSMRDNVRTEAAKLVPGQSIAVVVRPWADVERTLRSINRRDLDDEALLLAEPAWGDELRK
jgi:alginate O-acetyltransferase complex protein AlgJ